MMEIGDIIQGGEMLEVESYYDDNGSRIVTGEESGELEYDEAKVDETSKESFSACQMVSRKWLKALPDSIPALMQRFGVQIQAALATDEAKNKVGDIRLIIRIVD